MASLLIDAGLNPVEVQHQLGHHSAPFTLDLYTKRMKKKESITTVLNTAKNQVGLSQVVEIIK